MKSFYTFFWLTALFCFSNLGETYCQINISTNERIDAYWNDYKEEWIILSEKDNSTLFEFNEEMTTFKHTTASITSTYYIRSHDYDEVNETYDLEVVSDVGNKYNLIIDTEDNQLRFLYYRGDTLYLVQHTIKKAWSD